jgi:octaprenyl-diphosphate synthase
MVGVGSMRVMQVLADATNIIAEGEVLQLMNCRNADIGVDAYLQVIRYKTAKLFEAAGRLGAILGDASAGGRGGACRLWNPHRHRIPVDRRCARLLGQGGRDRQASGRRSRRGQTDPAADPRDPERHGKDQAALVREAIEQASGDRFADVLAAVRSSGALDAARRMAKPRRLWPRRLLAVLPDSKFRETLLQLADFAVQRSF